MAAEFRTCLFGARITTLFLLGCSLMFAGSASAAKESPATVRTMLIVVGPSSHPPGTHEEGAGARLLQYCLSHAKNVAGLSAVVVNQWPHDEAILDEVATVVFIGDQFPGARLENSERVMQDLTRMMARGCGMVCIHYATGLTEGDVAEDGNARGVGKIIR